MGSDRDPWLCGRCEIVNPWVNHTCRQCGGEREQVEKVPALEDESDVPRGEPFDGEGSFDLAEGPKREGALEPPLLFDESRRFNALAFVVGVIVLAAANWLGTGLVLSWAMKTSPEFERIAEQFEQSAPGRYEPTEEQKEAVSGVIKVFIGYFAFAVIILPFLIGLVLGRVTGRLAEAGWAMGVGATLQYLPEITGLVIVFVVLVIVAFSVGSGVLGASFGMRWKHAKAIARMPKD